MTLEEWEEKTPAQQMRIRERLRKAGEKEMASIKARKEELEREQRIHPIVRKLRRLLRLTR